MTADYPYPPDEFDVDPDGAGPRGAHREPETRRQRWWPLVAVLVGVPLLAYLLVSWVSDWDGLPGNDLPPVAEEPEDSQSPAPTGTEPAPTAGETTPAESPEPEPEAPPVAEPDLGMEVSVRNATTTSGLAGSAAERLADAGWTATTAGNWDGGAVPQSTVYFTEDDAVAEATAQAAAEELGIGRVLPSSGLDSPVTVVLESDYQP